MKESRDHNRTKGSPMLGWAFAFLIVALIAGAIGLSGVAGTASNIAYVLFVLFLVFALFGFLRGRRPSL